MLLISVGVLASRVWLSFAVKWFISHEDCIMGPAALSILPGMSFDECMGLCLEKRTALPCNSFNYMSGWCHLVSNTRATQGVRGPGNCPGSTYAEILTSANEGEANYFPSCGEFDCFPGYEVKVSEVLEAETTETSSSDCAKKCLQYGAACTSFSFHNNTCRLSDGDLSSAKFQEEANSKGCSIVS